MKSPEKCVRDSPASIRTVPWTNRLILEPGPPLRIDATVSTGGLMIKLTFVLVPGWDYEFQMSEDLRRWAMLVFVRVEGEVPNLDDAVTAGKDHRFYRLRIK